MADLARYEGVAFGISGSSVVLAPLASVAVRREDTGALASLFSDRDGLVGIANPVTADAYGRWGFYSAATTDGLRITVTEAASPGLEYTMRHQKNGTLGELDFNTLTLALLAASTGDAFLQTLLSNLTSDPDIALTDLIPFGDVSELKGNVTTIQRLFALLGAGLPVEASPSKTADYVVMFDTGSPGELRITLMQDLPLPKNYLTGGILSNTTFGSPNDITNDIDITAGEARDSTDAVNIRWSALNGKQLDAAFAAGSLAGMRSSDAMANGTWHIYAIRRDSDGAGDILADTDASSPTLPSGYTYFRRIGSILRESAAIVPFVQDGDQFLRRASVLDVNVTNPGTARVLRTLSIPTGVKMKALYNAETDSASTVHGAYFSSPDQNDEAASATAAPLVNLWAVAGPATGAAQIETMTNASAQISSRFQSSGASDTLRIATLGWFDRRGRDG